jgi:hypothetical protein
VFKLKFTHPRSHLLIGTGIHWASSIPAFLALACVPFPFLFYKYGSAIRMRCKYAAEADEFMKKFRDKPTEEGNSEKEENIKSIQV